MSYAAKELIIRKKVLVTLMEETQMTILKIMEQYAKQEVSQVLEDINKKVNKEKETSNVQEISGLAKAISIIDKYIK